MAIKTYPTDRTIHTNAQADKQSADLAVASYLESERTRAMKARVVQERGADISAHPFLSATHRPLAWIAISSSVLDRIQLSTRATQPLMNKLAKHSAWAKLYQAGCAPRLAAISSAALVKEGDAPAYELLIAVMVKIDDATSSYHDQAQPVIDVLRAVVADLEGFSPAIKAAVNAAVVPDSHIAARLANPPSSRHIERLPLRQLLDSWCDPVAWGFTARANPIMWHVVKTVAATLTR